MLSIIKKLQKQLLELWKAFENRLLESHYFNLLTEKYQSLNISTQKAIKYFSIFLFLCAILYLPLSYFISSTGSWRDIKSKYNLSLQMLKIREKKSSPFLQGKESFVTMKINQAIQKYSKEDNFTLNQKDKKFAKSKSIRQVDFDIKVPHLNIRQATQLGADLHALPQVLLKSITFTESEEHPKHYEIQYELSAFFFKKSLVKPTVKQKKEKRKKRKRERRKRKKLNKEKAQDSLTGLSSGIKSPPKKIKPKVRDEQRFSMDSKLSFPEKEDFKIQDESGFSQDFTSEFLNKREGKNE